MWSLISCLWTDTTDVGPLTGLLAALAAGCMRVEFTLTRTSGSKVFVVVVLLNISFSVVLGSSAVSFHSSTSLSTACSSSWASQPLVTEPCFGILRVGKKRTSARSGKVSEISAVHGKVQLRAVVPHKF